MKFRLKYYDVRKEKLLDRLTRELLVANNRMRFIQEILDGGLKINGRKKVDIESDLTQMKFEQVEGSYDYLLSMPIHTLTKEKFDELLASSKKKQKDFS